MVGMDGATVAIGMGNGGGAKHTGGMCLPTQRPGAPPVAETIHDACIDPTTLLGWTLHDHRDKGPFLGTVFA